MHAGAKIQLMTAHVEKMIIIHEPVASVLGESHDAMSAKSLMNSVRDVHADSRLVCLCVLLWLLEDTPASVEPLDDVVMFCGGLGSTGQGTLDYFQAFLN